MNIYCSNCGTTQPVFVADCRDAKTDAPFQDIVCKECAYLIASGTGIQREWVGLTDEDKRQIFDRKDYQSWLDYINTIEAKLKAKNFA